MKKIYFVILGLLGVHLFLLVNLQFTAWPEMVSFPYLFNNGFKLYGDMVHAYPPLLTLVLAGLYKIIGYKLLVLKVFTWVGILACDILIFKIAKEFTKSSVLAFLSLTSYILLQPFLDGNMLWFDTALTLPILLAIYFRKNLFLAGTFLAIALLTKQTALIFIVAFFLYARNFRFLIPIGLSLAAFLLWLIATDQLTQFYNWNFYYPATFWTKYPSYQILTLTKREISTALLVLLPALLLAVRKFRELIKNKDLLLLFLFLAAGIFAVYPRFSFYHFQSALAIAAILLGVSLKFFKFSYMLPAIYYLLLVAVISLPVLKTNWQKETRFWDLRDLGLARTIRSEVDGSVYLLGPQSALYVMSEVLPPKPWVDNFGWYFEMPGVQEETIRRWEQNPPTTIIWQDPQGGEWYEIGTYQPQRIVEWVMANYNKEKEIEAGIWLWTLRQAQGKEK